MYRLLIWAANTVLGVLCCFLVANILVQAVFTPSPADTSDLPTPAPPEKARQRSPEVILERNLFNVASLGLPPTPVVEPDDDLEATKLPLKLLGTAAAADAALSWAAVEDVDARKHLVVRVGDVLIRDARVDRIERRRIILRNGTRREELALDDEEGEVSASSRPSRNRAVARRATPPRSKDLADRVRRLAQDRFSVPREDARAVARNPAALFSQARILPKYTDGQMVGVQLNSVRPGSVFEQIGIQDGDTVVEFNGVRIESPEQSAELMRELSEADQLTLVVTGTDGSDRTLVYQFE